MSRRKSRYPGQREEQNVEGYFKFNHGILSYQEKQHVFQTLPVTSPLSKEDIVKYFFQARNGLARTKAVIGRSVQNCHPPGSVTVVNKMLEDFKAGNKDSEEFWLHLGEAYVYIRYYAVRDENGTYLGTMEVTQNIKPVQAIQGEKRLLSE
jgi:DUF438 domain-containing protein